MSLRKCRFCVRGKSDGRLRLAFTVFWYPNTWGVGVGWLCFWSRLFKACGASSDGGLCMQSLSRNRMLDYTMRLTNQRASFSWEVIVLVHWFRPLFLDGVVFQYRAWPVFAILTGKGVGCDGTIFQPFANTSSHFPLHAVNSSSSSTQPTLTKPTTSLALSQISCNTLLASPSSKS